MKKFDFLILSIFLLLYLLIFSLQKIDLVTSDLGRHITNGRIFIHSAEYGVTKSDILHTNFFSYTNNAFPFINHHWASGVMTYLIFTLFSFGGLSIVYFILVAITLIILALVIKKETDMFSLITVGLLLIPLISNRVEVRPEGLSYLLISFFLYILYKFSKNEVSHKILYAIPFLEIIWVNSHIYFIFGPFFVGIFLLETLILKQYEKTKKIVKILIATIIATLITPYGIKGIIYPFIIFKNYGYRVVENQSIHFLENLSFINPAFFWYKFILAIIVISSVYIILYQRKNFLISFTLISLTFAILAFLGIRHTTAFAFVSLPLLSYNVSKITEKIRINLDENLKMIMSGIIIFVIIYITFLQFSSKLPWNRNYGIGIENGDLRSINFIKENNISGPFFNNYDIGGYLIYSLFPNEKVFIDNRPEAYHKQFFNDTYIPMQENYSVWKEELKNWNFNVIYFYRLDYTPWAQNFLIQRISDPLWAPVYVDEKTIILLRRNTKNDALIKKFELSKNIFNIK